MLVETIEPERRGQTLALAMSFISCGTVSGPAIAGTLFQCVGYWAAWAVPVGLLGLDAVARGVMADNAPPLAGKVDGACDDPELDASEPRESDSLLRSHQTKSYETIDECSTYGKDNNNSEVTVRSSFSSCSSSSTSTLDSSSNATAPNPTPNFYLTTLTTPALLAGLANTFGFSFILAAFDTTLPLFLRNTFGWGSMPVGLIFLGLQGPIIILGPLVGKMRDRFGCRVPTVLGWALVAPFLALLALVGRPEIAWATSGGSYGEALVIVCIAGIGVGFLLIRGAGAFQVICTVTPSPSSQLNSFKDLIIRLANLMRLFRSRRTIPRISKSRPLRPSWQQFEGVCPDGECVQRSHAAWATDLWEFAGGLRVSLVELFHV